jgi:hypothetical protein
MSYAFLVGHNTTAILVPQLDGNPKNADRGANQKDGSKTCQLLDIVF